MITTRLALIAGIVLAGMAAFLLTATPSLLAAPPFGDPPRLPVDPDDSFSPTVSARQPILLAGGWETPVNVSANEGASNAPSLGVDRNGTVHVAWYDDSPPASNWEILYAAKPITSSAWVSRENVSSNGGYSQVPSLLIDGNDAVSIAWQDYGGPTRLVWQGSLLFKEQEPDGLFASLAVISATTGFGGFPATQDPHLVADSANTLHLAWAGNTVDGYRVFYTRRILIPGGPVWLLPSVINPGSGNSLRPRLVVDSADRLHIVWQEIAPGSNQADIYYSTLLPDETWAAPTNISRNSGASREPWLLAGHDGALYAVWCDYSVNADQGEVFFAHKPAGGAWTAPENVSLTVGDSAGPVIVEDVMGDLHLIWFDNSPGNWEILYASKPLGGDWSSASNVSGTPGWSGRPNLFYDPRGKLHLAWADDSSGNLDIYYSTKVIPVFAASSKHGPATALAGDRLPYQIVVRNASPFPVTVSMTDTVPAETTLVSGSATASTGTITEVIDQVQWTGSVAANGQVRIRLQTTVNTSVSVGAEVVNRAVLSGEGGASVQVEAATRIMHTRVYLPLIGRDF